MNTFEILARGRCNFGGTWHEGDVRFHHNGTVTIKPKESVDGTGFYVDPSTVSVFVQRTDKNGKHVFDGDICVRRGSDDGEAYEDYFFIAYDDENCAFVVDGRAYTPLIDKESFAAEVEVIGNKWDDPEFYEKLKAFYGRRSA